MFVCYRREAKIQELIQSYEVYEDLLAKSNKGIEFYKKLESNVNLLLDKSRDKCKMAEEEREHIRRRLKPKGELVNHVWICKQVMRQGDV